MLDFDFDEITIDETDTFDTPDFPIYVDVMDAPADWDAGNVCFDPYV